MKFRELFRFPDPPAQYAPIPLDSPCPACGHRGCKLIFNPAEKKVERHCNTCGCIARQEPVAPELFK